MCMFTTVLTDSPLQAHLIMESMRNIHVNLEAKWVCVYDEATS